MRRRPVVLCIGSLACCSFLSHLLCSVTKMYKESKRRRVAGNQEHICEATIDWNAMSLAFCALCGVLGDTVGGLLGSGGGFVLGPLLLEIGVIPQLWLLVQQQDL